MDNASEHRPSRPTVACMPDVASGPEPPVVPGYTLEALLGRGGSGEVWRARPRSGGPAVAVKVLVDGDPERQAREAALLGELDHPHLVRVLDVVHQPRRGGPAGVALVLQLLDGGSLAALLARRGRLRPGEVVTAIAPVAAALAHAHENGVVHGDLSPGNIVFTAEGRPVLTDLGVARVLGESSAGEVTPAYVDPTVARGGAPGPASDVFGIAAAAFHALTGVAPWNAATPGDTLVVAAEGQLPDLVELAPEAPPALITVISRGLAADPHDRGSAAAFALDLRHACRPEAVRLPALGVPDIDLGRTGRGHRTELTHQVPGRRRHAAPVEPAARRPAQRLRWPGVRVPASVRPAARVGVPLGLLLACLLGVGWAGNWWGGTAEAARAPVRSGGASIAAASSAATPSAAEATPAPATAESWTSLVANLYRRRAAAFGSTSGAPTLAPLAGVYTADCPSRAADEQQVRALLTAGEQLRGFAPTVVQVSTFRISGERVELRLTDRWAAYDVVPVARPHGPALRTAAARGEAQVRMVLVSTPAGWRIEQAQRVS